METTKSYQQLCEMFEEIWEVIDRTDAPDVVRYLLELASEVAWWAHSDREMRGA